MAMTKPFRTFLLVLSFVFMFSKGVAQQEDTLTFAKGRFLTSLYGSIGSEKATQNNGSNKSLKTTNNSIGTKSGIFISDGLALGFNFSLAKEEVSNNDIIVNAEEIIIGIWSRLYFAKKGSGALFADITPFFTAIDRQSTVQVGGVITDNEQLHGIGFGIEPAIGFTYIINKNVGFGMSTSYRFSRIKADRKDLITNVSTNEYFNVNRLQFNFNFQVYLDQFFF